MFNQLGSTNNLLTMNYLHSLLRNLLQFGRRIVGKRGPGDGRARLDRDAAGAIEQGGGGGRLRGRGGVHQTGRGRGSFLRNGPVEAGKKFCHAGAQAAMLRRERAGSALERAGWMPAERVIERRRQGGVR